MCYGSAMADGFDIRIEHEQAERLRAAAEAAGAQPEDYARQLLAQALEADWAEDHARISEYERTGEAVGVEEAMARFRADVETRLTARK